MTQNLISNEPTQTRSEWQLAITVDMVLRGQGPNRRKFAPASLNLLFWQNARSPKAMV